MHFTCINDSLDELDGGLSRLAWYWNHFYPFWELVNGHEQVLMSSNRLWHLADNVQPLDHEQPGDWNWLQRLSRLVCVLRVVLAGFAGLD